MAILLGSANRTVIKRWRGLLSSFSLEQASSLAEVRKRCLKKPFDLVVLHRSLVDAQSFAALRTSVPATRFFLLSDRPNEEEGLLFLKIGIVGYANTYIAPGRIGEAIHVINSGGVWLGRNIVQRLIFETAARPNESNTGENSLKLNDLTRMERRVAELVACGMTNLEIAADLNITERTVKAHLTKAYEKTRTGNRLALALLVNRK